MGSPLSRHMVIVYRGVAGVCWTRKTISAQFRQNSEVQSFMLHQAMDTTFPKIVAASIDGRVHNVRYRQDQFHRLQSAILRDLEEIKHSISQEFSRSAQEVQAEICLALKDVRTHYSSLDAARAVQNEYLVANGHDNIDRRRGAGIVYILPTRHTLFYSVIAALSAALAAGNCIILEVRDYRLLEQCIICGTNFMVNSFHRPLL